MRKLLLKILPPRIVEFYKNYKKRSRSKQRELLEKSNNVVSQKDIEEAILKIGITAGDIVMLHSSLSKIGFVKNGAATVINSFINVLGSSGTLVMPAFPAIGFNLDYLRSNPVFDIKNTPSKMGVITETFRKMAGVLRSFHPTDSVCAMGAKAQEITNSHYAQLTPYNSNSPFYKLCRLKAKIILLGVDLNSLTNLHTLEDAEDNFKFPVYHSQIFECEMINEKGEKSVMKTKSHDPKWSKQRKCNELIPLFKAAGFLKEGKLGNASVMLIEADAMHEWMMKSYKEKGITMYTPKGI